MFLQQVFEAGILIYHAALRILCQNKCWTFPRENSLSIFCLYNIYLWCLLESSWHLKQAVHSSIQNISSKMLPKMQGFHQPVRLPQQNHKLLSGAFGEPAKAQVLVSNENQLRPNVPLLALKGRKVPTAVGARHMQKTRKATLETLRKTMGIGKSQNQNNITTSLAGVPTIQKKNPGIRTPKPGSGSGVASNTSAPTSWGSLRIGRPNTPKPDSDFHVSVWVLPKIVTQNGWWK